MVGDSVYSDEDVGISAMLHMKLRVLLCLPNQPDKRRKLIVHSLLAKILHLADNIAATMTACYYFIY